ncbi:MAG: hypothetical protein ACRD0C_01020, partial [Acidimicrobiia bacterium]
MPQQGPGRPGLGGRRPPSRGPSAAHGGVVTVSEAEDRALVDGAGLIDGRDRGSVLVSGPDAQSFLHSLLSQDVAGLAPGEGAHT